MQTKIILVRHGETVWNLERRSQGFSDIALSETGLEQARALAKALKSEDLSQVYASDLVRSVKTAETIAAPHKIMVKMDVRLRELNQGELEGSHLKDLLADHPELLKVWLETPADVVMPGGESMSALQKRAWRAITDIVEAHPDQTVCVVAHNLCNLSIICKALDLDLNKFRRIKMENASISEIIFGNRDPVLTKINDTSHLKHLIRAKRAGFKKTGL